jgi:hypothetical protein
LSSDIKNPSRAITRSRGVFAAQKREDERKGTWVEDHKTESFTRVGPFTNKEWEFGKNLQVCPLTRTGKSRKIKKL